MTFIFLFTTVFAIEAAKETPFTFVQICDTQLGMGGYEHDVNSFKQAVKQINALKPDFTVICGDLVNRANDKSFADFNKIKAGLTVPCYCAAGNHDIGNTPTSSTLKIYRELIGEDYYSFEHRGYTFIVVNTQIWKHPLEDETEKHDSWFKKTLIDAYNKKSPVFIIGHYPLFLKHPEEEDEYFNLPLDKRREVLALFVKYGVVAMLGGHTHKLIINEYKGIQLLNGETTSKNFDNRPFGFRLWHVTPSQSPRNEFVPLDE